MTPPPDEPRAWLDKAGADLRAARTLQEVADLPRELAAFHFQQAAEKALKGLLVLAGVVPPRTHDLRLLLETVPDRPQGLTPEAADAARPYAVLARYPGLDAQPEPATMLLVEAFAASCVAALSSRVGQAGVDE